MRALVEIVHPADVLFFLRPIRAFQARGDTVAIASRHKDVACDLLDRFGLTHQPLSTAGRGAFGLARELAVREARLWRMARRFRPDVMLGFGGVAIAHVGRLTGVPSGVFYDSENARLQTRLAWPFVTDLTVPDDYGGPTPAGRTTRLMGIKELSYLHPSAFRPDPARAIAAGLDPARPNVLIRVVDWRANHDLGKAGWSEDEAAALVAALAPRAALHVSAEAGAPAAFTPHLWRGDPAEIHHLMGLCDAYIGESCTMACEAATLGVPALYAGVDFPGYVRGMARRGLVKLVEPGARAGLAGAAAALLDDRAAFDAARATWLAEAPDWAEKVVAVADRLAAR